MHDNANRVVVRANEMFLEYFLPCLLARITETNKLYASQNERDDYDAAAAGGGGDLSEAMRNQIVDENIFSIMCRDFVDLLKTFFDLKSVNCPPSTKDHDTSEHDEQMNDEMASVTAGSTASSAPANTMSDLAVHLLQTNKTIFQTVILCLFEGLSWPDSYCCSRLVVRCSHIKLKLLFFVFCLF